MIFSFFNNCEQILKHNCTSAVPSLTLFSAQKEFSTLKLCVENIGERLIWTSERLCQFALVYNKLYHYHISRRKTNTSSPKLQSLFLSSADDLFPLALEVSVDLVHECLGSEVVCALFDVVSVHANGEILGHVPCLNGVNDCLLKGVGELGEELIAVELGPVLEAAGPREDGGRGSRSPALPCHR
ncbi:hypothetical protein FGO68_gene4708 [Halteria grandinella]|uniref:Uncharacterized protein n=1 Tax=Halteria grandinella TaxID=5974 RepID=A0A8J8TAZ3_HALGN|nr:hypothetical protein FGO68_gene4708 [Halteria grandinella]